MSTPQEPQLFSGNLRAFPGIPTSWSSAKRAIAESILSDVRAAFPEMLRAPVTSADIEDFWEDACRVSAAWRASGQNLVAKEPGSWNTRWTDAEMKRRLGPVSRTEEGGHHGPDRLILHPLLRQHGGRAMTLGSIDLDPSTDVTEWLAARHRDHGVQRGIVKAVARKFGIWSVELDSDPEVIARRLFQAMDWAYMNLEDGSDLVVAQDAIDLQFEYRLFVVDGELISGAGCVEEFTPLNQMLSAGPFDSRVRRIRGHLHQGAPSAVEDRPDVVGRLLDFGAELAHQHGGTVVIDVALDAAAGPEGTPVVVELNDLPNSGLYASDPWAVATALVGAHDRGYAI